MTWKDRFAFAVFLSLGLLSSGTALAQGAASCLFECDSKCYGIPGPYCRSDCMAACNRGSGQTQPSQFYGAVYATNDGSGAYGYSYGKHNQNDALATAHSQCRARGGPCLRLLVFANKCAAVVYAKRTSEILGIFGAAEPSQAAANRNAMQLCDSQDPGATCEVADQFCSLTDE